MRKYIYIMMVMLFMPTMLSAQNSDSLYVYQHSGPIDSLAMATVKDISHSRLNLKGETQSDYVVMVVSLKNDDMRQYLLADIDSVVMVRGDIRIHLTRFVGGMTDNSGNRSARRTSLDGDFMASTSEVDFFWEEGDHIYLEDGRRDTLATISDTKRTGDFYFGGNKLTADNVTVYYAGQTPIAYNNVRVAKDQTQQTANNTEHIGVAGDCGTATAAKQQDGSYRFNLDHHAAYLCFLPYISNDLGRTVLKSITVRSGGGLAGDFTLTTDGLTTKANTDYEHTVTLTTGDFVLPRNYDQNTSAYMVIAPQSGATRLTCEFTVYDNLLGSTGVYTKTVDLKDGIARNTVYVIKANCNNYVVDLGLPVKFLNHNMGAGAPEEYGGYYAWGELEDKGNYSSSNYTVNDLPKNIRLTDMDVAHMRLGGSFSMPTSAEFNLLVDSCSWSWQPLNSKPGYVITGKNGNKLFLPAAGYRNGTSNYEFNTRGLYRTSQITNSTDRNWLLSFVSNSKEVAGSTSGGYDTYTKLWLGESVRPVISTGVQMTDGSLVQVMTDSVQWKATELNAKLYGTLYGYAKAKDKDAIQIGFVVGKTDSVTIANGGTKVTASVSADGAYHADFTMPKDTAYYYRAYAMDADGNVEYANALQFGRCYVDLGLPSGTKWANINVGATRPDEDGDYFSWGEPDTKTSFSQSTNIWYQNSTWLEPDRLYNVQSTCYDAASKNWGGVWMTPDFADFQELVDNCTPSDATMNGINGYLFTSNHNQNSIFVPKAAYRRNSAINEPAQYTTRSCLASSQLPMVDAGGNRWTTLAYFLDKTTPTNGWERYDGISLRPVYKTNASSANSSDMFIRTLPARKSYNGTIEYDTLRAVIRGLENAGSGTTIGIVYWKHGSEAKEIVPLSADENGYVKTIISFPIPGPDEGTTYHFAGYVNNGTEVFYGNTLDMTTIEMVDLGLSVKWANMNLGAENEGAGGLCYRWGALEPYRNTKQQYIISSDLTVDSGHDMVSNMWGDTYRLPTKEEYQELIDNTTFATETRNGVNGHVLTSNINGRSIFFPSDGYWESSYHRHDGWSDYWSSTGNGEDNAYYYAFKYENVGGVYEGSKGYGFEVRGVQHKMANLRTCNIGRNTMSVAETDTLKAYIQTISGNDVSVGFEFSENADMSNAQQLSAGTASIGYFTYILSGLQKGKTYYYRAYATEGTSTIYGKTLKFELLRMVDLGLPSGKLWASVNLGANSPEDFGDYYAWGETHPKESYTQANHQYYDNGYIQLGYNIKATEYDAATANMGQIWGLPTQSENNEIVTYDKLTWTSLTINGKNCWKVKSSVTGDSLILPRAGIRDGVGYYKYSNGNLVYPDRGLYMASTRYDNSNCDCLYLQPDAYTTNNNREVKYRGFSVRGITNALDTIASGVIARVLTDSCKWTIGAATATLYGTAACWGAVSMSYGFIVGTIQEVDTDTPAVGNVHAATNLDGNNRFSINYNYDGSAKFFRAYIKVGSTYYFGDIKSITAATLLSAEFKADGTIFNGAPTKLNAVKTGSPTVSYNSGYKRYEVAFANTHGSNSSQLYSFDYRNRDDFIKHLSDGHSIEALVMLPTTPTKNDEADIIADFQNGGSGIGIRDKEIWTDIYLGSEYQKIKSGVIPESGLYYHVVAVYDKDYGIRLYVDGKNKGEIQADGAYHSPDAACRFFTISGNPNSSNNASSSSSGWPGTVVFARIYDEPLTAEQVLTLYNNLKE